MKGACLPVLPDAWLKRLRLFAQPLFMRRGRFLQSNNRRSPPSEFNVVDVLLEADWRDRLNPRR